MIRLSQYAIIDVSPTSVSRDLDADVLHLYTFNQNNRQFRQFVQNDAKEINSREFAFGPYTQNIWLNPTPYFYPEEHIAANFHADSTLQNVLGQGTLPVMQYKTVSLLLSQGYGYTSSFRGITCRVFVKLQNSSEVTLASIYDLAASSNISAANQVLHESQIFNTKLEFEIPDLDYILNSQDADISALRTLLFGSEVPSKLYIEYSAMDPNNIDSIVVSNKQYTIFNLSAINSANIDISIHQSEVYADVELNTFNNALLSSLKHERFDVEQYLNKFKSSEESYTVTHYATTTAYDAESALIGSSALMLSNPISEFGQIEYRPLITADTSYFETSISISVRNTQTGISMTHTSSIVISDPSAVDKFKPEPSLISLTVNNDTVFSRTNKTINQLTASSETPDVIQITKPIYVSLQSAADTLELLPAAFTTSIMINIDTALIKSTHLQIGSVQIPNIAGELLTYSIPLKAYHTTAEDFYILNEFKEVINTGKIIRK